MNLSKQPLKKTHSVYDCLYWILFLAIPFLIACHAIGNRSIGWVFGYIILTILIFAVVVIRYFCTHCPHYIQSQDTVKCMFIRGLPKYFKPKPGPYDFSEKIIVWISLPIWLFFPLFWLYAHPVLLLVYLVSITVFAATMKRYECGRCIHFNCPVNDVPEDIKKEFSMSETKAPGDWK